MRAGIALIFAAIPQPLLASPIPIHCLEHATSTARNLCIAAESDEASRSSRGEWRLLPPDIDRITDEVRTRTVLDSHLATNSRLNGELLSLKAFIAMTCRKQLAGASIAFLSLKVSSPRSVVTYRFDKQPAVTGTMHPTADNGGVRLRDGADAQKFAGQLRRSKTLVVRIDDPHLGRTEAEFNTARAGDGLAGLACLSPAR